MISIFIDTPGLLVSWTISATWVASLSSVSVASERRSSSSMASAAMVFTEDPPEMMPMLRVLRGA
jgi:hypothetical protein